MFCFRKTGNSKRLYPGELVKVEKTKSFKCHKFSWLHLARNRLIVHYMVYAIGYRMYRVNAEKKTTFRTVNVGIKLK
jgi:hypothetical protein